MFDFAIWDLGFTVNLQILPFFALHAWYFNQQKMLLYYLKQILEMRIYEKPISSQNESSFQILSFSQKCKILPI